MLKKCMFCENIFKVKPSKYDKRTTCGAKSCISKNMSMRLKGKKKSKEHVLKMTEALIRNGDERGRKISKSLKGKAKTYLHKKNLSKAHEGKILSDIHKKRIGESNKGKKNSEKQKRIAGMVMRKAWIENGYAIAKKISETKIKNGAMVGEKNINWRGGISFAPYPILFNKSLKRLIKERDEYICQNPNCKQQNKFLHIHHVDYNKQNCYFLNLITLCRPCHTQTNYNRKYWTNFYSQTIIQKYLKVA